VSGNEALCGRTRERLALLLAGEIDPEDRREVEAHLRSCPACRREAGAIGSTLRALEGAGGEVPDPGPAYWAAFNARLLARIGRAARLRRRAFLAAAAAVFLAAGVGIAAYRGRSGGAAGPSPPVAAAGAEGAASAEARLDLLLRRAAAHDDGLRSAHAALDEILPAEVDLQGAGAL
jgi:anti-sigma factor RsiW